MRWSVSQATGSGKINGVVITFQTKSSGEPIMTKLPSIRK